MKINLLVLLISLPLLVSCGSKDFEPINTKNVELDLKDKEKIRLWCRSTFSFEAIGDGKYTAESKDISIAKVVVEGNRITVRTVNPGITDITIMSNSGDKSVLKCYSRTFAYTWAETPELKLIYQNSVTVAASDQSVAEKIRAELKPFSLNRGNQYTFTEGSDELSVLIPAQGDPVNGTYLWNVETQTLTLNYKGRTERFTCDIQPEYPNLIYLPRFIMAVKQDLTEEYASKYPDAGIIDVYIIRHMMSQGDYWITDRE